MEIQDTLFNYLKIKIPNFTKVKQSGNFIFTCPNIQSHTYKNTTTATFISGTTKIQCLICGWKGTAPYDIVRLLEPEKKNWSDAQITDYLISLLNLDMYKELDAYVNYGFSLTPLLKNEKKAFEDDWRNKEHKDKIQWIKWLNNGLNIGLNCEKSNVIVIDVDCKHDIPEIAKEDRTALINLLETAQTLKAKTPSGGFHYVFKWNEELRHQETDLAQTLIDTRTEGQIVVAPSSINSISYTWMNLGTEIKEITKEIKDKILELKIKETKYKEDFSKEASAVESTAPNQALELTNNNLEGCCNDTFVQFGGVLIKMGIDPKNVSSILHYLNRNWLKNPMQVESVNAMVRSLSGYKVDEEKTQEKAIYEYLEKIGADVTAREISEALKIQIPICSKWLSVFVKDGRAIRMGIGRYQYKEKIKWSDTAPEKIQAYEYKVPLFGDIMNFQHGDVLILGAFRNDGKTTIALNMLADMIKQGVKPFYVYSESGSRFQTTGDILNITGKYFHTFHENPMAIELEYNAFTIIDWLGIENKAETDSVLKKLNDEMQRKRGILVIFTQLKEDRTWFAPNLIEHYPAFSARYYQDNPFEKTSGYWQCDKIKDPKGEFTQFTLQCVYDKKTRIFKPKDLI